VGSPRVVGAADRRDLNRGGMRYAKSRDNRACDPVDSIGAVKQNPAMPQPEAPFVTAETAADGGLVLRAGGEWSIHKVVPALTEVSARLQDSSTVGSVRFDFSQLGAWDSSLVSFVAGVARHCRETKIPLQMVGLPRGVQQLARMALAVPEQNIRRTPEKELFFTRLGKAGITVGANLVEVFAFVGMACLAFGRLFRGKAVFRWSEAWLIVQRCGAEALPIVTLINFLIGLILGFVGGVQLQAFGAAIYMATLVGVAMARELGCLMTGIIMSGRTGASFAAEIGSMKASQEIDALKTLGLSPIDFLVLPRLLALVLMMPLLTIYGNVIGMFGGAVLAPVFGVSYLQYYNQLVASVDLPNYAVGIIKSGFFGAIVAGAGCLRGMEAGNSASAVGLATTSAVVSAITAIIALDALFAFVLTVLGI
jgi:phospholipid/cholesterol/gamma-HCH transport system permease protein